jgi:hypothetical protein
MAAGTLGSLGSSITNYFHDCAVLLPFGVAAGGRNVMASFDITIIRPQEAASAREAQKTEGWALARSGGCVVLNPSVMLRCTFAP